MKSIEMSAHSVKEAVNLALEKMNLKENDVDIKILEEPSKGFFGILGGKLAKVKVMEKTTPISKTKIFLEEVTERMGLNVDILATSKNEYINLEFVGKNLGVLIGRRGDTLDALQYLSNIVANKGNESDRLRIIIDAEGYRERRNETLSRLAIRISEKVKKNGHSVVLEPMNPQERRIIHTILQNDQEIQTFSEGEEPYRKVVIALKER